MKYRLNCGGYSYLSSLTSNNKLFIIGGYNNKQINQIYTIDLLSGEKEILSESHEILWSIYPMFYANEQYNFFSTGEEELNLPEHFTYKLNH
jgi:hypothetical protein